MIDQQFRAFNDSKIDTSKFVGFVELGIDFWEQAGKELVRLKGIDPDIFEVITNEHSWITRDMLTVLEQIGLKKIHPSTLLMPNHVFEKVSEMPYEDQRYLADKATRIEVLDESRTCGRHPGTVQKRVRDLTKPEAALAIANGKLRTPQEQLAAIGPEKGQPREKAMGRFALTFMNGSLWVRKHERQIGERPQRIVLSPEKTAVIEVVMEEAKLENAT